MEINEVPRFLASNPTTSSHSIVIADPTDDAHHFIIPLQLEGVVNFFEYILPTSAKYEDDDIPHLELTAASPAWDPYDDDFALQEESHLDFRGHLISAARRWSLPGGRAWGQACRRKLRRGTPLETQSSFLAVQYC